MSQDPQGMIDQTEDQLHLLGKAVEQRDVSKIQHHAQELDGMRNLSGPTPMTDAQRQHLRDIATAIDKLDEIEVGPLQSVADALRDLSELGLR